MASARTTSQEVKKHDGTDNCDMDLLQGTILLLPFMATWICFKCNRFLLRLALAFGLLLLVVVVMLRSLLVLVRVHQLGGDLPLMPSRDLPVGVHLSLLLRPLLPPMKTADLHVLLLILVGKLLGIRHLLKCWF